MILNNNLNYCLSLIHILGKTFYSRAAGQLPSGIAPHAVRQDQHQGVIPGQDGKGILLIACLLYTSRLNRSGLVMRVKMTRLIWDLGTVLAP